MSQGGLQQLKHNITLYEKQFKTNLKQLLVIFVAMSMLITYWLRTNNIPEKRNGLCPYLLLMLHLQNPLQTFQNVDSHLQGAFKFTVTWDKTFLVTLELDTSKSIRYTCCFNTGDSEGGITKNPSSTFSTSRNLKQKFSFEGKLCLLTWEGSFLCVCVCVYASMHVRM